MCVYEDRQKVVKKWAKQRWGKTLVVHHNTKTQKASKWARKIGYPFADHMNEIAGKGLVVQPYDHSRSIPPHYAEEISLEEDWVQGDTKAYFIDSVYY